MRVFGHYSQCSSRPDTINRFRSSKTPQSFGEGEVESVDAMGIARLLDEQQPDNMNNSSALTEEVSKNNDPKRPKAKQIFLGIDAHLARNQVARKKDNSGIQGVQSFSVEELLLFAQKQLSLAEEVYAVYEAGPLGNVLYRRLRELGIKAYVKRTGMFGTRKTQAQQAGRPQAG